MAAKFKPAYVFIYLQLHMLKKKKKEMCRIFLSFYFLEVEYDEVSSCETWPEI